MQGNGASVHNMLMIGEIVDISGDRISNMFDGPTLAPAGMAARLVRLLRSTAGNGLGRFIALSFTGFIWSADFEYRFAAGYDSR
jgi:hypothetical protein